jgi:hypothetical protein
MSLETSLEALAAAVDRLTTAVAERGALVTAPVVTEAKPKAPKKAAVAAPIVAETAPAAPIQQKDVIDALTAYAKVKGLDAIKALVAELGAKTVVGIAEDRWAEAIAKAAL